MDGLIYRDLSGKARLRRYVSAALVLLGLIAAAAVGLARSRTAQYIPAQRAAPAHDFQPAALIQAVPTPTAAAAIMPCPSDPDEWRFVEVFAGDHYRRVEPNCVLAGLERTAAWMLLSRMGYSKTDAAVLLGLDYLPWTPLLSFIGYSNLKGPLEMDLLSGWPAHPEFHFWQVDRDGVPAVAISLRGCYRSPDPRTSVLCVFALDRGPGSAVSVLGAHRFASHAAHLPGSRSFHVVRYDGRGSWALLGQIDLPQLEIENLAQMAEERQAFAGKLGAEAWDAAWLFDRFGFRPKQLPEDWRLLDMDPAAVEAIAEALNAYITPALEIPHEE